MTTGGVLWFTDLTASDPYYVLPLAASATMLATIEVRFALDVKLGSVHNIPGLRPGVSFFAFSLSFLLRLFIVGFSVLVSVHFLLTFSFLP